MTFDAQEPYDGLPPLPPERDVETKAVLRKCVSATRALAELKGAGGLIPDQAILINAIPLQEAKLSSEIENIVTTQDELFVAALDETRVKDPQTKEVLRYRTALRDGYFALGKQKLDLSMIRQICRTLRDENIDFRSRDEQVFIGNAQTRTVTYTPPTGGRPLRTKLKNLERYLQETTGPDPLIRMAVSHYQFEAIHPFTDGNGRTGRILNILYLLDAGLLQIPVLYLSRYIIQQKAEYYRRLQAVTADGAWEDWVLYMLSGVEETALWTTERIHKIREVFDRTVEQCRDQLPRVYSKELIELLFRQPYCKISFVVRAGIAKRKTASEYLQALAEEGILIGQKVGREMIYRNPALLDVLTA